MGIKIQMVGTGNAFSKKYLNNNALIHDDKYTLMIDFGTTAPIGLSLLRFPLDRIKAVLITHLHADHIGGLEELAFSMKYLHHGKMKLYIAETLVETLWENSLKAGLEDESEGMTKLEDYFDVVVLQPNVEYTLHDNLRIKLLHTRHVPNKYSYSVLINDSIFYSSDMTFHPELLQALHEQGIEHILHDCQFNEPGVVHTTLNELMTLPEEVQRKIWLMHYADTMEEFIGKTGQLKFIQKHLVYDF